jgi:SAM-dependent methyltransferase
MNLSTHDSTSTSQRCRICGFINQTDGYAVKEMMFGTRHEFLYFQCSECECLQIVSFPKDMAIYYPADYYSLAQDDSIKFDGVKGVFRRFAIKCLLRNKTILDRFLQRLYAPISLRVLKDLGTHPSTRILDVGCGSGHKFLYPLAELQYKNILGCDPFVQSSIQYPNGLRILKADIFEMEGKWDVITYHHAFEHTKNPQENLNRVSDLLADNGVCILRIPTVSSYAWRHYKTNWFQIDAPRHYFLHSIKSIRYLAEKSGLELSNVIYDSTYKQFADSERYATDESLRTPRKKGLVNFLKRKLAKLEYQRRAAALNKAKDGDQAAFFLRKSMDRPN